MDGKVIIDYIEDEPKFFGKQINNFEEAMNRDLNFYQSEFYEESSGFKSMKRNRDWNINMPKIQIIKN